MPSNTARSITSKEMLLAWAIIQRCYSMSCALLKQVVNRFAHESCCEACDESYQSSSIGLIRGQAGPYHKRPCNLSPLHNSATFCQSSAIYPLYLAKGSRRVASTRFRMGAFHGKNQSCSPPEASRMPSIKVSLRLGMLVAITPGKDSSGPRASKISPNHHTLGRNRKIKKRMAANLVGCFKPFLCRINPTSNFVPALACLTTWAPDMLPSRRTQRRARPEE